MKTYIFLTNEGYTYQPDSESIEPDIDNCQVLGFAQGENEKEAFHRFLQKNEYLLETSFSEVYCYQLANLEKTYFTLPNSKS